MSCLRSIFCIPETLFLEAILKGLNNPDLIKLVLQLESEMNCDIKELTSEIRELGTQMKKVEADVAIVKYVNQKNVNQQVKMGRKCWTNVQYSRQECLEVLGIRTSIPNDLLKLMSRKVYINLEFMWRGKTFRQCHRLKDNYRAIVKFTTGKTVFRFSVTRTIANVWIR